MGSARYDLLSITAIAIGTLILLAGCGVAVFRADEERAERELETSSDLMIRKIVDIYSRGGLYISYPLMSSRPDLILEDEGVEGRSGAITLSVIGQEDILIYLPDGVDTSGSHDERGTSSGLTVPVEMGGGPVLPGGLEVVLYE